jgi:hypothetical protein
MWFLMGRLTMSGWKYALAPLAVGLALGLAASVSRAASVDVKTKLGVPTGAVVTLSHVEALAVGNGQALVIPGLPEAFVKPFRKLAAKIKATDRGSGVKVTLTVRVLPPGIKSKVEAR